jgi:hypothetical protein
MELMMEAVRTSETSVTFNVITRRYIPEEFKLHTRCRESLKSHKVAVIIAGSNPAEDVDVCLLCLYDVLSCVGRCLATG